MKRARNLPALLGIFLASLLGIWGLHWAVTRAILETAGETSIVPPGNADNVPTFQPSEPAVMQQLSGTVSNQLAAFRGNDFARAYGYASIALREQFPLPVFEQMVRQGYPAILASTRADFLAALDNGREALLAVKLYTRDRPIGRFEYQLRREGEGWKVGGVAEVRSRPRKDGPEPKK